MKTGSFVIDRNATVWFLALIVLLGGIAAFFNLGRLEDPEFTIKTAVVYTSYPGASPTEVEQEVTDKLEIAIQQLSQLKEVRSRSIRGLSIIEVEVKEKYGKGQLPQVWDELRRKIGDAQAGLPPGAGPSLVHDDFGDVFGIFFAVTGEGYSYAELKDYVDLLRKELLLVKGVAKVSLYGVQGEVVYVEMSPRKMAQLGIRPAVIYNALLKRNLVSNSGKIAVSDLYIPLELPREFKNPDTLGEMLIASGKGNLIRLRDVAVIKRGYATPPSQILRQQGLPALGLGISIVPGGNVVELGQAVKTRLEQLGGRTPVGMELSVISFQADLVENAVDGFLLNLFEAVIIVIGVLMVFMGFRSGLIIGATLLLTIAGTFLVMDLLSINLQRISLGALVLALGMLVDNAIVVTEGMLVSISIGMNSRQAADQVVGQTAWPLLGATIVAILAFAALGLSQNAAGEFCYSLFQVMLISLLLSWLFAITVTPLMCHKFLKVKNAGPDWNPYRGLLFRAYRPLLKLCLRFRWGTVLVMLGLFMLSLYGFQFVDRSFFPSSTRPDFLVNFWLPEGTHIGQTDRQLEKLRGYVSKLPGVISVTSFVGQGGLRYTLAMSPEFPNSAYGQLKVRVEDYKTIEGLLAEVARYAQKELPNAVCITQKFVFGPGGTGKVRVSFTGDDPNVLRSLAEQVLTIMAQEPTARDQRLDWRQRARVLHPVVATAQAERNGISPADIAAAVNQFTAGITVGVYRERDKLLPIIVRPAASEANTVEKLERQPIWSPAAQRMIPMGQVVSRVEVGWEDPIIFRLNRKRTIEAICDPKKGTAETLRRKIAPLIESIDLPPGYTMEWTGEYKDSKEANESVFAGFPYALMGMVIIVVIMFNAFRQPLIIFLCLPMAIIGVTAGLLLTGLPLNFMAVLGLLSLSGMLIKNAVVLIDQINLEIRAGKTKLQSIAEASIGRVRPVTMAAFTTVLGMAPLLLDAFFQSMAVTIMAGLSFATVLTLLVVPVLYALMFSVGKRAPSFVE